VKSAWTATGGSPSVEATAQVTLSISVCLLFISVCLLILAIAGRLVGDCIWRIREREDHQNCTVRCIVFHSARQCELFLHRDVRKTKIRFRFTFKNQTMQKFDIHSDGFPIETACNPPFK